MPLVAVPRVQISDRSSQSPTQNDSLHLSLWSELHSPGHSAPGCHLLTVPTAPRHALPPAELACSSFELHSVLLLGPCLQRASPTVSCTSPSWFLSPFKTAQPFPAPGSLSGSSWWGTVLATASRHWSISCPNLSSPGQEVILTHTSQHQISRIQSRKKGRRRLFCRNSSSHPNTGPEGA